MSFDVHPILEPNQSPKAGVWYVLSPESGVTSPSERVGACANFVASDAGGGNVVLSCGATPEGPYADLYKLKIEGTVQWAQLPSKGLPARYEHCASIIGPLKQLHVFGGADATSSLNDLWQYNSVVGEWLEVKSKGSLPPPRTCHTTTVVWKDKLVLFGGGAIGSDPVNDTKVYVFDPVTLEWTTPPISGTPPKIRQGHISVVVGDRLFVHGGMSGQDVLNDVHMLDLDEWKWSQPKITGSIPVPSLAAHSCAVIDKTIFVFGGLTPNGSASDELYCLDTETLQWRRVIVDGPSPPSRLDHAMCTILLSVSSDTSQQQATSVTSSPHTTLSDNTPPSTMTSIFDPAHPTSPDVASSSAAEMMKESSLLKQGISDGVHDIACTAKTVVGLFVFGGMDTFGNIHGDMFVYIPPS